MTPTPQRAQPDSGPNIGPDIGHSETPESIDGELLLESYAGEFDQGTWEHRISEQRGAGGRQVLGGALALLAAAWIGYVAWTAGRALAGVPLSSPAVAQWIAAAAGPLGLIGLGWLMFGRTRRKESERFTRSVIAMRGEVRSLEALLEVLSQQIRDSRADLTDVSRSLMSLGDEASVRIGGVTRELNVSSEQLLRHGAAFDRAAESARNDIAVLLGDLPQAEQTARAVAAHVQTIGNETATRVAGLTSQIESLAEHSRTADQSMAEIVDRLTARLGEIEQAGTRAVEGVNAADAGFSGTLDQLLDRASQTLSEIRSGIDAQGQAVAALVAQASSGIGAAGADAAQSLAANVDHANQALDGLATRVSEQDRASQGMIAEIDRGLAMIDQRFGELAALGDTRANHFLESLGRARTELDTLAAQAGTQDSAIDALTERTHGLRESMERLASDVREGIGVALGEAQGSADRLAGSTAAIKPEIDWVRDAAVEASSRLAASGADIADQQDRLTALLASVDDGVGDAQTQLAALQAAIGEAQAEAGNLSAETAPAMVAALVQVKEAAAHAAERARDAIHGIIPASVEKLSQQTRDALERVIRDSIEERLQGVEAVAARAVEAARSAGDRLTHQMLSIGQSAAALEQHIARTDSERREQDSEAFSRRVTLLIDSMHSASIDVGKILSDEIDDKAWDNYLKGDRAVFTRRAVRLLGGTETRALRDHFDSDPEFQSAVNRYVHDFEAMLRRVLAERDGGMIAVTLLSSDMGKLYAALAQAIDRRR
ncbi:MAG: hypothetical protein ABIS38_04765 [Sphingomicrobium sp.]